MLCINRLLPRSLIYYIRGECISNVIMLLRYLITSKINKTRILQQRQIFILKTVQILIFRTVEFWVGFLNSERNVECIDDVDFMFYDRV